jgi:hypothetical protein
MTLVLAIAAIAVAAAMLRALLGGRAPASVPALAAVGAALLLTFQGLATLDGSIRAMNEKHDRFAPLSARDAFENAALSVGIDPAFSAWAASQVERGETFALLGSFRVGTEHWLAYRLAPNTLARDRRSADWLIFFETPDPYAKHGLRPEDYARLSWGPDAGMLRRIGAR